MKARRPTESDVPSNTLAYFVREAFRRLWVSRRTSFAAIAMIAIALLVLGAFLLVAENLGRAAERWQSRSRIVVYFETAVSDAQFDAVDRRLASNPRLARRTRVSREEALTRFRESFGNLSQVVDQLGENPFPPSIEIDVEPNLVSSGVLRTELTAIRSMPGVDELQYDWEWVERLRRLIGVVNLIGVTVGGILALAAAFTIANTIRLTVMLYREEIAIMRLVGATERMIRGPFLVEGLLQGTIGGFISIALLYAGWDIARRSLAPSASILWSFLFLGFLPWQKLAALIGGGMVAGWLGSWLSVRRRWSAAAAGCRPPPRPTRTSRPRGPRSRPSSRWPPSWRTWRASSWPRTRAWCATPSTCTATSSTATRSGTSRTTSRASRPACAPPPPSTWAPPSTSWR